MSKKVCLISGCFYGQVKGGTEYQQYLVGSHLKKLGHHVSYLFIDNGGPIENESHFDLYKIKKRKFMKTLFNQYFFLDAFKVYNTLKRIEPDVILIRSGFAYTGIAAFYSKRNNCKMIWSVALKGDVEPFHPEWRRSVLFRYIDKKFHEYGIKNAEHIIAQARYQDDLLKSNYGRKSSLIVMNFHPRPKCKIIKEKPIKIIWVANFKAFKQPEFFIDLAGKFRDYTDLRFIMIGRSSGQKNWQSKLEDSIDNLDNLSYLGERTIDEVNRILCESHIFVNTSKYEGLPNTFVQAWMRRVPVVSLNVDPDDILKNKNIGYHSGSFENLVNDLKNLIQKKELREEMGERAQEYAFQNHALETNIQKIGSLIKSL